MTETCHRFLDLTGPFQVGGLPSPLSTDHVVLHNNHFVGCMRDLYIDGQLLDLGSFVWSNGTSEGCPEKADFCQSSPCQNSGRTFVCGFYFLNRCMMNSVKAGVERPDLTRPIGGRIASSDRVAGRCQPGNVGPTFRLSPIGSDRVV